MPEEGYVWRYLTAAEARALTCNRCGDCCDSRQLDSPHDCQWGALPASQYAEYNDGVPLIIPLEERDGRYVDAEWRHGMGVATRALRDATSFRCVRLVVWPDGETSCGLHNKPRPPVCGDFPQLPSESVEPGDERECRAAGLERCTWAGVLLVSDDEPALAWRDRDLRIAVRDLPAEQGRHVLELHGNAGKPAK